MHTLSIFTATALLACLAGCGGPKPPEPASPAPGTPGSAPRAAAAAPAAPAATAPDGDVVHRFDCQAGTTVALLENGDARVSLPGGERYVLSPVAGSEPRVYTGDSLYFTIAAARTDAGTRTAYLSQQDGMRELACNEAG